MENLRRREALIALSGMGAAGLAWAARGPLGLLSPDAAEAACLLTPQATEGPFWVDNNLTRRDIRAGQAGVPLLLRLTVKNADTCRAIPGADVELWHSNRRGAYSGVQGNSQRYLRGHQKANSQGLVIFRTIYPGWYRGRTPHIHVKVHVGGSEVHTGQLFFSDTVSRAVYRTSLYRSRGQADTTNAEDSIYADAGRARSRLVLTKRPGSLGYLGTQTLMVQA